MPRWSATARENEVAGDRLVAAARSSADELVREARRQGDLLVEEARAAARGIRTDGDELAAITRVVDGMERELRRASEHVARSLTATGTGMQRLERRLATVVGETAAVPLRTAGAATAGPTAVVVPAPATGAERAIPLPSRATVLRIAYWGAVFLVALLIVIALVFMLESRDLSSLEPG